MTKDVNVLIVEDRSDDVKFLVDELEDAGYRVQCRNVSDAAGMKRALDEEEFDLVTSDHMMPTFSSRSALSILKESGRDIPFIIVSGSIGEVEAVEIMKAGAHDYITKDNMERLIPAVERELREADNRVKRRQAEEDLRRSEQRLRELLEDAEKINRMKDEFLATLSHELRTPLNAIIGHSELLMIEEPGSAGFLESVDAIYRNGKAQLQLINELLDVSRIIAGKFPLHPGETEVNDVIEGAVSAVQFEAKARRIEIRLELGESVGKIMADPDRLQQVFWNLLTNAIKFTSEGGRVSVSSERTASEICVKVKDNGVGIEPGFLPHVFDRFQQEDSSLTRGHGGLGLGLSIARHIVELHGGKIKAASEGRGQGSTFSVWLPIRSH